MALSGDNLGASKAALINQSSRIEKHRTNFETLKGEFLNLQRVRLNINYKGGDSMFYLRFYHTINLVLKIPCCMFVFINFNCYYKTLHRT